MFHNTFCSYLEQLSHISGMIICRKFSGLNFGTCVNFLDYSESSLLYLDLPNSLKTGSIYCQGPILKLKSLVSWP
jgi:hypothetical protein